MLGRWFQLALVEPTGYLVGGLGQQYARASHVLGMWLHSFESGPLVRRADIRHVMRCKVS